MGLEAYAAQCKVLANELLGSLDKNGIKSLRDDLKGMDSQQWYQWRRDHESVVSGYVAATPSLRRSKKAWSDDSMRRKLVLAAYQHCLEAHAVLDAIACGNFSPGGSYRDMAAYAGSYYWRILMNYFPIWPFENPSPFDD